MVLKPPIDICSPISKSPKRRVRTPLADSRSGSNYWVSTLLGLSLRLAVWSLSSVLNPPVSHPRPVSSIAGFFSSTSQLGVSFFLMLLLDLTIGPPSKQLFITSWRLSPNLTPSNGSNFLLSGFPLSFSVLRKGISAISAGRSVSELFSKLSTLSLSSSLISGSIETILLSDRSSSYRVRMVNTSFGM